MLFASAGRRFVWLKLDEHPDWTTLWWTTKWPFKKINSKRMFGDNISPSLDEVTHLTVRDVDRAEILDAFFTSNSTDGPREPCRPVT